MAIPLDVSLVEEQNPWTELVRPSRLLPPCYQSHGKAWATTATLCLLRCLELCPRRAGSSPRRTKRVTKWEVENTARARVHAMVADVTRCSARNQATDNAH